MKIPVLVLGKTHKLIINKIKIDSIYLKNVFLLVLQMNDDTRKSPQQGLSSGQLPSVSDSLTESLRIACHALELLCDVKAAEIETQNDTIKDQEDTIKNQEDTIKEQEATIKEQKARIKFLEQKLN